MSMRAAVYHGVGDVRIEQRAEPAPGAGEVLVRVAAAGVCGTDAGEYLHRPVMIRTDERGTPDVVVLGHEFAGEIVAVGAGVDRSRVGELTVCGAGISCGTCVPCRAGRTNLCLDYHTIGFHRDGGLAELVTSPAGICVPVGDRGLSADTAALAQPMAVAVHARTRGGVTDGSVVLIIGVGGIGSFLTYACVAAGAHVVVADLDTDRLKLARSLGAAEAIDAGNTAPAAALAAAGLRPDVVFEVTGTGPGLDAALNAASPGARLVLVGIQKAAYPAPAARLTLQEIDVVGTVAHVCATDLPGALDVLATRPSWDDVAPTVFALTDLVDEGLVAVGHGRARQIKVLFDPSAVGARPAEHTRVKVRTR
jgi:threonine dehydrogenase-like Zn-dependent dehydrogenase